MNRPPERRNTALEMVAARVDQRIAILELEGREEGLVADELGVRAHFDAIDAGALWALRCVLDDVKDARWDERGEARDRYFARSLRATLRGKVSA